MTLPAIKIGRAAKLAVVQYLVQLLGLKEVVVRHALSAIGKKHESDFPASTSWRVQRAIAGRATLEERITKGALPWQQTLPRNAISVSRSLPRRSVSWPGPCP